MAFPLEGNAAFVPLDGRVAGMVTVRVFPLIEMAVADKATRVVIRLVIESMYCV